jgi:hypothetical protein
MKIIKWILIVLAVMGLFAYFGMDYLKEHTKKASPEEVVEYKNEHIALSVFYCRPYKKGREIFGQLVPYNEVWRTGANEATTFSCNKAIKFGDEDLPAGTYTLWTIPQSSQWTVIVNSKQYDWGVSFGGEASREAEFDVLKINVPVQDLQQVVEQFTISFEFDVNLVMAWDKTRISIPITYYQ